MNMHDPAHPGEVLAGWIDDLGLSITGFARHVGVSRVMLSRILHGHAAVSADMDLRLAEALGTSPGFWLRMLGQHDLWKARQRAGERAPVARLAA
jgi:addiction module HigA family antidote